MAGQSNRLLASPRFPPAIFLSFDTLLLKPQRSCCCCCGCLNSQLSELRMSRRRLGDLSMGHKKSGGEGQAANTGVRQLLIFIQCSLCEKIIWVFTHITLIFQLSLLPFLPNFLFCLFFNLYQIQDIFYALDKSSFHMRPRLSMKGCVRGSVHLMFSLHFFTTRGGGQSVDKAK